MSHQCTQTVWYWPCCDWRRGNARKHLHDVQSRINWSLFSSGTCTDPWPPVLSGWYPKVRQVRNSVQNEENTLIDIRRTFPIMDWCASAVKMFPVNELIVQLIFALQMTKQAWFVCDKPISLRLKLWHHTTKRGPVPYFEKHCCKSLFVHCDGRALLLHLISYFHQPQRTFLHFVKVIWKNTNILHKKTSITCTNCTTNFVLCARNWCTITTSFFSSICCSDSCLLRLQFGL